MKYSIRKILRKIKKQAVNKLQQKIPSCPLSGCGGMLCFLQDSAVGLVEIVQNILRFCSQRVGSYGGELCFAPETPEHSHGG